MYTLYTDRHRFSLSPCLTWTTTALQSDQRIIANSSRINHIQTIETMIPDPHEYTQSHLEPHSNHEVDGRIQSMPSGHNDNRRRHHYHLRSLGCPPMRSCKLCSPDDMWILSLTIRPNISFEIRLDLVNLTIRITYHQGRTHLLSEHHLSIKRQTQRTRRNTLFIDLIKRPLSQLRSQIKGYRRTPRMYSLSIRKKQYMVYQRLNPSVSPSSRTLRTSQTRISTGVAQHAVMAYKTSSVARMYLSPSYGNS